MVASGTSSLYKVSAVTWKRVKEVTKNEVKIQQLIPFIIKGFSEQSASLPPSFQCFRRYCDSLLIVDDVVLLGDHVVIPTSLLPD